NDCGILPDHHLAHAYSCYPVCGFSKALVLVVDGMGDDAQFLRCTSLYRGENNHLILQYAQYMPHSLGAFYNLFTELYFNF
ncbi:carbamoyltransferase N-terminal domain-containing protein, partial [Acinetobacter baumannii]